MGSRRDRDLVWYMSVVLFPSKKSHQCFYVEPTVPTPCQPKTEMIYIKIQTIPLLRCIAKFACVLLCVVMEEALYCACCVDTGRHDAENQDATFGSSRCVKPYRLDPFSIRPPMNSPLTLLTSPLVSSGGGVGTEKKKS